MFTNFAIGMLGVVFSFILFCGFLSVVALAWLLLFGVAKLFDGDDTEF